MRWADDSLIQCLLQLPAKGFWSWKLGQLEAIRALLIRQLAINARRKTWISGKSDSSQPVAEMSSSLLQDMYNLGNFSAIKKWTKQYYAHAHNQNLSATRTLTWEPLLKTCQYTLDTMSHALVFHCSCRSLLLSVASTTKSSAPSKVTVTWIFLMPLPPPWKSRGIGPCWSLFSTDAGN